jgi:hypothetical protein
MQYKITQLVQDISAAALIIVNALRYESIAALTCKLSVTKIAGRVDPTLCLMIYVVH